MRPIVCILVLLLMGCKGTPYHDDYVRHVNILPSPYLHPDHIQFTYAGSSFVDLRGQYQKNDTATPTPILYQGGAGLAGLLVQIGAHSAMIENQRDSTLTSSQKKANEQIFPFIEIAKEIPLLSLTGPHRSLIVEDNAISSEVVSLKPIFFSNTDMTKLSLKLIVWIADDKSNSSSREKYTYKNLVQVYSPVITAVEREQIINGNKSLLFGKLSSLLSTAIEIVKNELTGVYATIEKEEKTLIVEGLTNDRKVFRGSVISDSCGYQVIKDIRSWFIAHPTPSSSSNLEVSTKTQQCL